MIARWVRGSRARGFALPASSVTCGELSAANAAQLHNDDSRTVAQRFRASRASFQPLIGSLLAADAEFIAGCHSRCYRDNHRTWRQQSGAGDVLLHRSIDEADILAVLRRERHDRSIRNWITRAVAYGLGLDENALRRTLSLDP